MSRQSPADAAPRGVDASQIEFVTRGVTAAEVAAVTAVLNAMLQEQSAQQRQRPERARGMWASREGLVRQPAHPGPGQWRSFSG